MFFNLIYDVKILCHVLRQTFNLKCSERYYFVPCEQYDKLMEEFKSTHKESESIKSAGSSTAELRADIEAMEKEHNIVLKKIERMQRKVGYKL